MHSRSITSSGIITSSGSDNRNSTSGKRISNSSESVMAEVAAVIVVIVVLVPVDLIIVIHSRSSQRGCMSAVVVLVLVLVHQNDSLHINITDFALIQQLGSALVPVASLFPKSQCRMFSRGFLTLMAQLPNRVCCLSAKFLQRVLLGQLCEADKKKDVQVDPYFPQDVEEKITEHRETS